MNATFLDTTRRDLYNNVKNFKAFSVKFLQESDIKKATSQPTLVQDAKEILNFIENR
jgi:hypothetical protein